MNLIKDILCYLIAHVWTILVIILVAVLLYMVFDTVLFGSSTGRDILYV